MEGIQPMVFMFHGLRSVQKTRGETAPPGGSNDRSGGKLLGIDLDPISSIFRNGSIFINGRVEERDGSVLGHKQSTNGKDRTIHRSFPFGPSVLPPAFWVSLRDATLAPWGRKSLGSLHTVALGGRTEQDGDEFRGDRIATSSEQEDATRSKGHRY